MEKAEYIKLVNEIDKISSEKLCYISCFRKEINSKPQLDFKENAEIYKAFCKQIDNVDCKEVFLDKTTGKYLFVISRYIDNGYGLLYCKNEETFEELRNERLNGLQITCIVKAENNWYYVGFT